LANTALRFEFVNDRTVVLKRGEVTSRAEALGQHLQPARVEAGDAASGTQTREKSDGVADMEVRDQTDKVDFMANADIPRTIDDVQPYFIFDAKTIEQSGIMDLSTFLRERVTQVSTAEDFLDNPGNFGESSTTSTREPAASIELRSYMGSESTLVL